MIMDGLSKILDNISSVRVMGVLNITPDSFSDGGVNYRLSRALRSAEEMVLCGADIIDIGGESTRPGAEPVPVEEELKRVIPVVEAVRKNFPEVIISIDTYKSAVAQRALDSGANWINDISGGTFSDDMFRVAARNGANIVISHIKGTPRNMQKNPQYDDVVGEICSWLKARAREAEGCGVSADHIIVDPGIGFGKRYEDNITILRHIDDFKALGYRLLIGTSRKSFIGHYTGESDASKRDPASYVTFIWSAAMGADIIRVHDVRGTIQALRMASVLIDERVSL